MKLTVGIYAPDTQGRISKVGELSYNGRKITATPPDKPLLVGLMRTPIKVLEHPRPIDPRREPELFMRSLWQRYRSPYLTAMKVSE